MYFNDDTIAAISTPPGEGAIAIVRLSGSCALDIIEKVFSGPIRTYKSHTAHQGNILDEKNNAIDSVLLLLFLSPNSYTSENLVEVHCHGGRVIVRKILERLLQAGARAALPGEFTFRAFLNKKIDLIQAESIQSLISAKNELALSTALNQLEGNLSKVILSLQKQLIDTASEIEAEIDFSDEGLEVASIKEISSSIKKVIATMQKLSDTFHEGRFLFDGISICIVGSVNVGKSTLMNALIGKERAIVSPTPGTTRDFIEEFINIGSLHFKLIDTAGFRETLDRIEEQGIEKSKEKMQEADFSLLLLDASKPLEKIDLELIKKYNPEKTLIIWNKIDLGKPSLKLDNSVEISAKEKIGLNNLINELEKLIFKNPISKEATIITKLRHKEALDVAISYCQSALSAPSLELMAIDIKAALKSLGSIIGLDVTEDILSSIFSKFCVGK